jgi:hypothetical protein
MARACLISHVDRLVAPAVRGRADWPPVGRTSVLNAGDRAWRSCLWSTRCRSCSAANWPAASRLKLALAVTAAVNGYQPQSPPTPPGAGGRRCGSHLLGPRSGSRAGSGQSPPPAPTAWWARAAAWCLSEVVLIRFRRPRAPADGSAPPPALTLDLALDLALRDRLPQVYIQAERNREGGSLIAGTSPRCRCAGCRSSLTSRPLPWPVLSAFDSPAPSGCPRPLVLHLLDLWPWPDRRQAREVGRYWAAAQEPGPSGLRRTTERHREMTSTRWRAQEPAP